MTARLSRRIALALLPLSLLAGGCASTGGPQSNRDPIEPFNRSVFAFNEKADAWVLKPVAQAYVQVVPEVVRMMVGNAISNVGDLWTAANQLLQGKPADAASDLFRFTVNTTFGFFGVADMASPMGFEKHREDFGQTLGRWGLASGPYLVLPIFGPSSVRDGAGFAVDFAANPVRHTATEGQSNNFTLARIIDGRASLLSTERLIDGAALDRYSFIRDGYLQRRRNQVFDGNPPASQDD
ncbi:MAG TPA: VacJ family lipoprotein [Burkholderiaceae bacterium]|nr:VacJ family lipoprotein [Burkholderiaceae bacterium]